MDEVMENLVFQIIAVAGDARCKATEAILNAKKNKLDEADRLIKEAREGIVPAHQLQMDLIVDESRGNKQDMNILLVHAQDHLMTAMMFIDLAEEIVDIHKTLWDKISK